MKSKNNLYIQYQMAEDHSHQQSLPPNIQSNQISLGNNQHINPNLIRIHADNQDKNTLCLFWGILLVLIIFMLIVANFALPKTSQVLSNFQGLKGTNLENCKNPAIINANIVDCNTNFNNTQSLGSIIRKFRPSNQFLMIYFNLLPSSLSNQIKINQKINFKLYVVDQVTNAGQKKFKVNRLIANVTDNLEYPQKSWQPLYNIQKTTQVGFTSMVGVVTQLDDDLTYFIKIDFSKKSQVTTNLEIQIQNYMINSQFTAYTIIIRYVFFVIALVTGILYIYRFNKIPDQHKIIEQKMIAVASILLLMFNDPLYPVTILKPNGASSFFSIVFICNLIVFIILIWLVFADRITFEDGKRQTQQLTKKKIGYAVILWIIMVVMYMAYAIYQIEVSPFVSQQYLNNLLFGEVLLGTVSAIGIAYSIFRFIKICMADEIKLWRSTIFILFSLVFLLAVIIIISSNALAIFNYKPSSILLVYTFVNTYIIYLQYMYSITREELDKINQGTFEIQSQHDGITIGTIQMPQVDLGADGYYHQKADEIITNSVEVHHKNLEESEIEENENKEKDRKKQGDFSYEFDD